MIPFLGTTIKLETEIYRKERDTEIMLNFYSVIIQKSGKNLYFFVFIQSKTSLILQQYIYTGDIKTKRKN